MVALSVKKHAKIKNRRVVAFSVEKRCSRKKQNNSKMQVVSIVVTHFVDRTTIHVKMIKNETNLLTTSVKREKINMI